MSITQLIDELIVAVVSSCMPREYQQLTPRPAHEVRTELDTAVSALTAERDEAQREATLLRGLHLLPSATGVPLRDWKDVVQQYGGPYKASLMDLALAVILREHFLSIAESERDAALAEVARLRTERNE